MRIIVLLLSLLFFTTGMQAQSTDRKHPITQETFQLKLRVEKNRTPSVLQFVSQKGERRNAQITSPGDIPALKLPPGTILEGEFRFESFASDGGLGGTRAYDVIGKGPMKINAVLNPKGERVRSNLKSVDGLVIRLK